MMTHDDAQARLALLAVGDVPAAERDELTAHLFECEQCREDFAAMRKAADLLAAGLAAAAEPAPQLAPDRQAAILAREPAPPKPKKSRWFSVRQWQWNWRHTIQAAAVLAVVGVILHGMLLSAPPRARQRARQFCQTLDGSSREIAAAEESAPTAAPASPPPDRNNEWMNTLWADGHVEGAKPANRRRERRAGDDEAFDMAPPAPGGPPPAPRPVRKPLPRPEPPAKPQTARPVDRGRADALKRKAAPAASMPMPMEERKRETQAEAGQGLGGGGDWDFVVGDDFAAPADEQNHRAEKEVAWVGDKKDTDAGVSDFGGEFAESGTEMPRYKAKGQEVFKALEVGRELLQDKRYMRAREQYEKALKADPYNAEAARGLLAINERLDKDGRLRRWQALRERQAEVDWKWMDAVDADAAAETPAGEGGDSVAWIQETPTTAITETQVAAAAVAVPVVPTPAEPPSAPEPEPADTGMPEVPRRPPPPVNPFVLTRDDHFSTFALEADTAAYTQTRRFIANGYRPPPAVVRMEEFVNAFDYNYPAQTAQTFAIQAEGAPSPFRRELTLLKIGVKGKVLGRDGMRPTHLVFVVDASGSMARGDRLPLVQYALKLMVDQLRPDDRVSLIAYDIQPRLLLEAAPAVEAKHIRAVIDAIETGSSTNLLAGVKVGFELAKRHYRAGWNNRVVICSDGVANVGPSAAEDLLAQVGGLREQGITCTTVGVGAGAYDDRMLEQLANKGDGNYVYLDSPTEARRVFVEEFAATVQTIARDAKIQVDFNPDVVRRYRLIGYENRDVRDEDFRNDAVDAGEIGSGQAATALYELELLPGATGDLGTVYVRCRNVDTGGIEEISRRVRPADVAARGPAEAPYFYLAGAIGEFAELLRGSEYAKDSNLRTVEQLLIRVHNALPLNNQVREALDLVRRAQGLPVAQ